jgi:hypothetical protein
MNWYGIWVLKTLGLAWDIKRIKLSDVKQGLVPAPNGTLITPAESLAAAASGD